MDMKKKDWIRKLTSRKFWMSASGFVSMMIAALGGTESEGVQAAALIMAGATVISYVIGEGMTDCSGIQEDINDTQEEE